MPLIRKKRTVERIGKRVRVGSDMRKTGLRLDSNSSCLLEEKPHEMGPRPRGLLWPELKMFLSLFDIYGDSAAVELMSAGRWDSSWTQLEALLWWSKLDLDLNTEDCGSILAWGLETWLQPWPHHWNTVFHIPSSHGCTILCNVTGSNL